jgi:hypothetical protein
VFTEHYQCIADTFCQICVEEKQELKMTHQIIGMYCSAHKEIHLQRLRDQVINLFEERTGHSQ